MCTIISGDGYGVCTILGSGKVIRGLEMGMLDGCAGEDIVLIIPPEYGYGDVQADKVSLKEIYI